MASEFSLGTAALGTLVDLDGLHKGMSKAEDDAKTGMGKVGDVLGGALKVGAAAAATALVAVGAVLVDCVKGAMDAENVQSALAAVLKSTGGAAGMTAESVNDLANSLSQVTPFEDDVIVAGENMLLTFTNIGKDVFPMATEAMLNISTAMGTDLQSSAVQLGKALNNPVEGISALTRVGVTFTDEQKKVIKALQESGDMAGAQKVILAELEKEFGGAAKAAGTTFAGQMTILNNQLNGVKDNIGAAIIPVLSELAKVLGPVLIAAAKAFGEFVTSTLIPAFQSVVAWLQVNLPPAIQAASDIWNNVLLPALTAVSGFITGTVIPVVQSVVAWFTANWPQISTIVTTVIDTITATIKAAWDWITGAFKTGGGTTSGFWKDTWEDVQAILRTAQALLETIFTGIWTFIQSTFKTISEFLSTHGNEIKAILGGVWTYITGIISAALDLIKTILAAALLVLKGDWAGAWEVMKVGLAQVWEDIKSALGGALTVITTLFGGAWATIRSAAETAWTGLVDSIAGIFNGIVDKIKGSINGVIGVINGFISSYNKIAGALGMSQIGAIAYLAQGTMDFAGGLAMVGEQGPELLALPQHSQVYSNSQTRSMLAGAGVTVEIGSIDCRGSTLSRDDVRQAIADAFSQIGARADVRWRTA